MKMCPSCGQLVAEEIHHCPACGSEIAAGRKTIDDYRIEEILRPAPGNPPIGRRALVPGQ